MKTVFRVELSEKQDGSADGSGWFREPSFAFRPQLPMVPGWFLDGSVRFAWGLSATAKSYFAIRPQLPMIPGWFRDGSVRFAPSLSTAIQLYFATRPAPSPAPMRRGGHAARAATRRGAAPAP